MNTSENRNYLPHAALLTVQIFFGAWPILGKIALRELPPTELVAIRTCGAAIVFLLLNARFGRHIKFEPGDRFRIFTFSVFGVAANQLLFVKGLSMTTAISATLLQTSIPVFAYLIGMVIGSDTISVRKALGISMAIAGVFLMIGPTAGFSGGSIKGNLFILGNSCCYGTYIATSRGMVRKYGALKLTTWIFVIGAFLTLPLGLVSGLRDHQPELSIHLAAALLMIILLPTVAAYFLNAWALSRVSPSVVAVYTYLQPLFTFSVSPLLLGEKLTRTAVIASVAIVSGVLLVGRKSASPGSSESTGSWTEPSLQDVTD